MITYFDNSKCVTKLTMPDLKNVLGGINAVIFYPIQPSPSDACVSGEHVIVAWRCKEYMWELRVVEKNTNEKIGSAKKGRREKRQPIFQKYLRDLFEVS